MSQGNDLISRDKAIELVKNLYLDDDSTVECPDECNSMIDACIETLRELPAEPRWTPISDGLPEQRINKITLDLEYVLCTMKNGSVVPYKFGAKVGQEDKHFWGMYGGKIDDAVVAWMYLPDAYVPVEETVEETVDPVEERPETVEETTVLLGDAVEKLDKAITEYNDAMRKSLTKWCNKITDELFKAAKKLEEGDNDEASD